MNKIAIVVADPIHAAGLARLRADYDVAYLPEIVGNDQRQTALAAGEAIVVRTFTVDDALMERMPKLRLVAKHGSGVDNIDIPTATVRGVLVANTPGGSNAAAVAEGTVTLMLAVLRQVFKMDELVRGGRFSERWSVSTGELGGATVGLVGFGQIARTVAKICANGFGASILCHDPFVTREEMARHGVTAIQDIGELAERSDILSVHVPLTSDTANIVDAAVIARMPSHAILINTSRGGTVDENALAEALTCGWIAAAGIDVFATEPPEPNNPLLGVENVILSPHVAGVTENSLKGMADDTANVVDCFFSGARPATALN
jgi:D-3-phosphoglycerate dehydrogenase / 2-oxoglutarate reductase